MIITIIALENIEKEALLGVYAVEKIQKNTFLIDVKIHANLAKAFFSDALVDTIDYANVYKIIDETLEKGGNLLETKCYEIIKKVFKISEKIVKIEVKINKKQPATLENCAASSVQLVMTKTELEMLESEAQNLDS